MSYHVIMAALKAELEANTTIANYDCVVNIKIQGRNDSVRNSAFAIDLMLPDGDFIEPQNKTGSNDNSTLTVANLDVTDIEKYTFRFDIRAVKNGFSDEGELLDSDILKILDLQDKVRNSCADYFFKGDFPGYETTPVIPRNDEGQAGLIVTFDFILWEQICVRSR